MRERSELAIPLVTADQRVLALAQFSFRTPASCSLNQETRDQRRLNRKQRQGGEQVGSVLVPDVRITEPDERSGRHPSFVDPPALKLAPVDLIRVEIERGDRDVAR
jgi:hypothetical protein